LQQHAKTEPVLAPRDHQPIRASDFAAPLAPHGCELDAPD